MKPRMARSTIFHLCAMLLVSSIFGGIWYSASAHSDPPPGILLSATRDRLRICVHILPSLQGSSAQFVEALAKSVANIRSQHFYWDAAGYGETPKIEACPQDIPSFAVGEQAWGNIANQSAPEQTSTPNPEKQTVSDPIAKPYKSKWKRLRSRDEASPYRTVIYVVDDQILRDVMYAKKVASIAVESIAYSDDDIGTVTPGLVVSYEYLTHPNFTGYYLPRALGLPPLHDYVDTGE